MYLADTVHGHSLSMTLAPVGNVMGEEDVSASSQNRYDGGSPPLTFFSSGCAVGCVDVLIPTTPQSYRDAKRLTDTR
jgi:hypothetical protein